AKAGFLNAAAKWQERLQAKTPITIVLDVDFGPTRFGTPFGSNVLGATATQSLISSTGYSDIRAALISRADSPAETALYSSLPPAATGVPTDLTSGAVAGFVAPSALLRALGGINAVADPANEQAQFGSPPSIGFNSNFAFDFD